MAALVYVCARPQQGAAAAEFESFRVAMRLGDGELDHLDLVTGELPEDAFDRWRGFVVGGSPFNVVDPESTKTDAQRRLEEALGRIAEHAADARTRVMFTCYGIGIATRVLGGAVNRGFPEDTGPTTISLTDEGRTDPVFGELAPTFSALTAHKEGTETLPDGAVLLASGETCRVQAYRYGTHLYATQFHPEPTARDFVERMAVYRNDGYFDARDYDAISARVLASTITEPPRILRAFAGLVAAG